MEKNDYGIRYLPSFNKDLEEIVYYIAQILKNKDAAERLIENVSQAILKRSINPASFEIYNSVKKRNYDWYRIYVKNFTILYTVRNNTMEVVHIFYSKRNIEELI